MKENSAGISIAVSFLCSASLITAITVNGAGFSVSHKAYMADSFIGFASARYWVWKCPTPMAPIKPAMV